ncbi:hypothetical protein [Oleiharenicola sp. Vm1]|uniref:hypothetical protein n=1 Tax=Oleiharenicola sp. Vm1 TaxID=3398393 RepID=UPI0039F4AB03
MTTNQIRFLRDLIAAQGLHQRTRIERDRWVEEVGRWRGAGTQTVRAFIEAGLVEVEGNEAGQRWAAFRREVLEAIAE